MTSDTVILRRTIVRLTLQKIDPENYYNVPGDLTSDGDEKTAKNARIKGGDLTFNQIAELAIRGIFD